MSLDERLTSIVRDASTIGAGMDNFGALPKQEQEKEILGAVEQIKAAFADDGYTKAQSISYTTVLKDGVVNLVANPQNVELMTGQEWYDRFSTEMSKVTDMWLDQGNGFIEMRVLRKAARKASNLDA